MGEDPCRAREQEQAHRLRAIWHHAREEAEAAAKAEVEAKVRLRKLKAEEKARPKAVNNTIIIEIDKDVGRTMPLNVLYGGDGAGVEKLRRVLVVYSWWVSFRIVFSSLTDCFGLLDTTPWYATDNLNV